MMRRMTTQISVRLPDEMVSFLDRCVSEGRVASRAEIIAGAVEREMRREAAMRDAAILAEVVDDATTGPGAQPQHRRDALEGAVVTDR